MKTRLNLGLAFRDTYGVLRVSLQLMTDEHGAAVATADFVSGILARFLAAKVPLRFQTAFRSEASDCAQERTQKTFEWAYPTSENALKFGFGSSGCWLIELGLPGKPAHAVRAFPKDQKEYGISCARSLPFAWSSSVTSAHPEYVETDSAMKGSP